MFRPKEIDSLLFIKNWVLMGCLFLLLLYPSNGMSTLISIQLDYDLFGHVKNTPAGVCAATSVINSFQFLMNRYPTVYGKTDLIPGAGTDIVEARDKLDGGWIYNDTWRPGMGAVAGQLTHQRIWESKIWWVEDFAPNTTVFDGMYFMPGTDLSTWYHGEVLDNAFPTWEFLWVELSHGEDIEIAFDKPGTSLSHQISLTSLKFDDVNDNKKWDAGETRWLDYLDPNNPTKLFEAVLEFNETYKYFMFDWNNGGANNPVEDVRIFSAMSESPIPEPSTIFLMGFGILGILLVVRGEKA